MGDLLTITQIAKRYGCARPTAYKWVKGLSSLPAPRGRSRLYDANDVARLHPPTVIGKREEMPDFGEKGTSAVRAQGGALYEERLRELRGREGRVILREMRLNDPVIAAVFLAIENSIRKVEYRAKPVSEAPADIEAALFVESCFGDMSLSWSDTLQFILVMLEQGHSPCELVYKRRLGDNPRAYTKDPAPSLYDDGRVGWRKWALRPPESLAPGREWIFDENGGVQGIRQAPEYGDTTEREIPIQKLVIFRTSVLSPDGLPIHRAAYIPWWFSTNFQEIEAIAIERDLAGLPVVYMGNDTQRTGSNNAYDQAKKLVANLRNDEQAGVVFPYPKMGLSGEGRGILLELIASSGRRAFNTSQIIERQDKRKALSVLAQFIMLGMEAVGSYALGRLQADIFVLAVSAWATSIAETINRYAIPRLMRYNVFPGMTGLPKLVPSDVGIPNLEEMALYVNTLVNAGVLRADKEMERHLRQIAHLPPRDDVTTESGEGEEEAEGSEFVRGKRFLEAARVGLMMERLRRLREAGDIDERDAEEMISNLRGELGSLMGISKAVRVMRKYEQAIADLEDQAILKKELL